jgi:hypothetical protein
VAAPLVILAAIARAAEAIFAAFAYVMSCSFVLTDGAGSPYGIKRRATAGQSRQC